MTTSLGRSAASDDAAAAAGVLGAGGEAGGIAGGAHAAPSRAKSPSAVNAPDEESAIVDNLVCEVFGRIESWLAPRGRDRRTGAIATRPWLQGVTPTSGSVARTRRLAIGGG
jgi:hypothetical protein